MDSVWIRNLVVATVATIGIVRFAAIQRRRTRVRRSERSGGQNKRIWIFDQNAVTTDMPGNARHFEHAQSLPEHGWRATIFATGFSHKLGRSDRPVLWWRPIARRNESGIEAIWLYAFPYLHNNWRRYASMVTFFLSCLLASLIHRPRPDAVIGSSPHLLTGLAALLSARMHRVPFVLEVRDLWPDTLIDMGLTNPLVIAPLRWIEQLLYRNADATVIVAESFRAVVAAGGGREIRLIPNAPAKAGRPDAVRRRRLRERMNWRTETVFVYAGAFGTANGLETLIDAMLMLPEETHAVLVLVGSGSERERLTVLAGEDPRITFMAAVSRNELDDLLDAADVGVVSLRPAKVFEGVRPNKLYDYFAHALPAISNVPGEARCLLEEAGAGVFVEPGDAAALADAIAHLSMKDPTLDLLRSRAAEVAATMPTRADMAVHLAAVLDTVTTSPLTLSDVPGQTS